MTYANCLDIRFILGHVVQATGDFNFVVSQSLLRIGVESAVRRCTGENTNYNKILGNIDLFDGIRTTCDSGSLRDECGSTIIIFLDESMREGGVPRVATHGRFRATVDVIDGFFRRRPLPRSISAPRTTGIYFFQHSGPANVHV